MKLDNLIADRGTKKIYRDDNLAIKVFENDVFSKADILNEACNQARVEDLAELHIPRIREVCKIDGKWAIATEFVEGKTLQQLMDENPAKEDEYLEQFVDLQIKVHTFSVANLNSQKEKMQRKISQSALDATTRYELHTRLNALPSHNKVCHGDFNPSNIIIDNDGVPHILDWAHVTSGNASADVARTYLLFCLAGKDELAAKYLNLFCEKTDTARQYVEKWLPIVAASQSVKGKPEEKEFLLKWADVVDFE
jgi:aminoglycoside phosphotransferase (APT) family kinase protein